MTAIRSTRWALTPVVASAVVGLGAGGLTCYLHGVLPGDWNTVANSGAAWTVVAFVVAFTVARTPAAACLAGLLALVGEVAGYYGYLDAVLQLPATPSEEVLWTLAALWIGPLTGWAAHRARWGTAAERATAVTALAGMLAGEGAYLLRVAAVPGGGRVELALAVAVAGAALSTRRLPLRARGLALGVGALVAVAVYVAYRLPTLG